MTLSPIMPLPVPETPLWEPSPARAASSLLSDFKTRIEAKIGKPLEGYAGLWQWSVDNSPEFWSECWDYCGVIGEKGAVILKDGDKMPGAQFFPEAQLNYAENLLRRRDDKPAIIFRAEKGEDRILSAAQLYDQVSLWAQAFKDAGIQPGDRVAGYMPNMPETIIAMLAASSLGAIWSSASPDFGVQGLVDRFGQIKPKVLVAVDGYYYGGKTLDCLEKISQAQPQIEALEKTIIVPFVNRLPDVSSLKNAVTASDIIGQYQPSKIEFTRLPFNHPLFIMFSSGTTGKPKCIVHGQGGVLIQHLKEHKLQSDIKPEDKVFYFTTCGWMMWNWLVSGLAAEACLMLYDGSPFYPDGTMLWSYAEKHGCTFFGTSAKYIDALKSEGLRPVDKFDLSCVKTIASTGSPLVHESFDYVYASIKQDVHLASISGGTDIVSCFMLGNPISPVWRGELQGAGLGMAVNILNDDGQVLPAGNSGELVCLKPFPCMPVGFWDDDDGKRYHEAYFDRFPNIWCHGDWVEKT
ncbi:MAG: acetoacetate--CoA ligase, partial [Alphaproteobacteria bacterium]|nr:acetoacetate--CoA ligase [Alphaproteobacteria bacterium]